MSAMLPIGQFQEKSRLRRQERIFPAEMLPKPTSAREYTWWKQMATLRALAGFPALDSTSYGAKR
jgi:hypothetical protein